MDLDDAFMSKDEVGQAVLTQLRDVMKDYGYEIKKTLVTDLSPDNRVKASMNEINASRRLKEGKSLHCIIHPSLLDIPSDDVLLTMFQS
mmetsp:Transcript_15045/g.41849  ORF Transcript_15045/g.41849 Transcript_15045/m.41849 type:complete len:89 (+) Transcript_15045:549-815(+)